MRLYCRPREREPQPGPGPAILKALERGGGPGGVTRLFSILTYEIAIGEQRYALGTACALAVVPVLLVLIVILSRYMRADARGAVDLEHYGAWTRIGKIIGWPFAMIARGLLLILDIVGSSIEQIFTLVGRALAAVYVRGDNRREATSQRLSKRLGAVGAATALGLLIFVELCPFYWTIITAFKTDLQIQEYQSILWPAPWTLDHFMYMLSRTEFPHWFANSTQVAIVSCLLSVTVGALGAYAMVRLRWNGAGILATAIFFTYLVPSVLYFIPLYQIFNQLHLVNNLGALMVAYPTFGLPFACWLLMGYYRSIPEELEEAALIDGANHLQAFVQIILPLTAPALLTVGLFALTATFNEFLFAYVFVRPDELSTVPVGMYKMMVADVFPYGNMFAASLMMAVPVAAVYMVAQRYMSEGLTAGSVKG